MDLTTLDAIIDSRCEQAGLPARLARTPIRVWQKSGVERLHLADQTTVVVKYAGAPFTGEARILRALAVHGVPVPTVLAAHQTDALLVMLLQDLGERVREPTDRDGAHAAAHLHRAGVGRDGLDVWDAARLSQLPETIIQQLTLHHDAERLPATRCLLPPLQLLARHARRLVDGADIEPFGVVHGELHPTSVHIGDRGWHLVDLAMAFVGPGLLDLATWHGTRQPPDITRLQTHLHAYVAAGGHKTVLRSRGGLAATRWSLGWHRLWSVGWLLRQATTAPDDHRDPNVTDVLTRQIQAARCLLTSGP